VVLLRTKSRFLFRKGVIEVIFYLDKVGKAGYYEIYKKDFVVSRQTFANLLKELENKGIVSRKVVEGRPPRVEYSLTEKGKKTTRILNELNNLSHSNA
jgi:DNA-binding HxlR family transcriptional regulator